MQSTTQRSLIADIAVLTFLIGFISFLFLTPPPKGKVYDCSLSEISPDYPIEVKEQCRQLRAKNFQEDLRKPK